MKIEWYQLTGWHACNIFKFIPTKKECEVIYLIMGCLFDNFLRSAMWETFQQWQHTHHATSLSSISFWSVEFKSHWIQSHSTSQNQLIYPIDSLSQGATSRTGKTVCVMNYQVSSPPAHVRFHKRNTKAFLFFFKF